MPAAVQLVDGDAAFDRAAADAVAAASGLDAAGVGYQVVAVTGPQSSGKSTLLNAMVRYVAGEGRRAAGWPAAWCRCDARTRALTPSSLRSPVWHHV